MNRMPRRHLLMGVPGLGLLSPTCSLGATQTPAWVSMDGDWRFALDPSNVGIAREWYATPQSDLITLPGTTDENHKGKRNEKVETGRLTRLYPYYGAAWYQRNFLATPDWSGKRVAFVLERTKSTMLWLDGKKVGQENSLVGSHVYELGSLKPGRHTLALRISNTEHPDIGDPHQISDQIQTNWNGAVGRIGLMISDPVWIDDVQAYPDQQQRLVLARVTIRNTTGKRQTGELTLTAATGRGARPPVTVPFTLEGQTTVEANYPLGADALEWSEWMPYLHRMTVTLKAATYRHQSEVGFGLRRFAAHGTHFQINGKTTFLRGRHDAGTFPLTGYPPMSVPGWLHALGVAKSYGLNHVRFHTWCPPAAAFQAADQLGIYLQPELPNWQNYGETTHDDYMRAEGERILKQFGNHPSFVMLALGNEIGGDQPPRTALVKHFRSIDSRHLYAQGSNNWVSNLAEGDDYWTSFQVHTKKVRGSFGGVDKPLGHVQTGPPSTMKDYSAEIEGVPVPVIGHEIGEYQTAPDFREIPKYTGVLRARNFEAFRKRLEERGLGPQAEEFFRASGALAVRCYREDIEAALRTPGFGGFQLLDLQDFPGQGTALVGILNAFLESKGLIEPARWREFCSRTAPLLRFEKYTWTTAETFQAKAQLAHYGPEELKAEAQWAWNGEPVTIAERSFPQGAVTEIADVEKRLELESAPRTVSVSLSLKGTTVRNSYDIWLYPAKVDTAPGEVIVTRALDASTRGALAAGKSVLLLPELASLSNSIEGRWATDFWNWGMFKSLSESRKMPVEPGTLGLLCNPAHPGLRHFPTESHSDWQWFHLMQNSRALILDTVPGGYRPIVQVIDNYERAHRLGCVLEARVGQGKLVVCSIDLPALQDKPEARQLLYSLLRYMNSAEFAPGASLALTDIQAILGTR